jgi:hypothetical protein
MGQICVSHFLVYFLAICPFGYWLFHFLESQYAAFKQVPYGLGAHVRTLTKKNLYAAAEEASGSRALQLARAREQYLEQVRARQSQR